MKRMVIIIICMIFCSDCFSQSRLHAVGARGFGIWRLDTLVMNAVAGDAVSPCTCYFSEEECDGFCFEEETHAIRYTSVDLNWLAPGRPVIKSVSQTRMVLDKQTFDILRDMYVLAVSTSSFQVAYATEPSRDYFVHGQNIAEDGYDDHEMTDCSKQICSAIKENDVERIYALLPKINFLREYYRGLVEFNVYAGSYHMSVGSIFGRFQVSICEGESEIVKAEERRSRLLQKVARYILYNTDDTFHCEIYVKEGPMKSEMEENLLLTIWIRKKDLTYRNIIRIIEDTHGEQIL